MPRWGGWKGGESTWHAAEEGFIHIHLGYKLFPLTPYVDTIVYMKIQARCTVLDLNTACLKYRVDSCTEARKLADEPSWISNPLGDGNCGLPSPMPVPLVGLLAPSECLKCLPNS